jgi:hypothetical protein
MSEHTKYISSSLDDINRIRKGHFVAFIISAPNYCFNVDRIKLLSSEATTDFPDICDKDMTPFWVESCEPMRARWGIWFLVPHGTTHTEYTSLNALDFTFLPKH